MTATGQDNPRINSQPTLSQLEVSRSYLLHRAHSIHLVHLRPQTLDLDADSGALLHALLAVIRPLWWRSVRVELDIGGNHLLPVLVDGYVRRESGELTLRPTNACREPQSTKKPVRSTEVTIPSIYVWHIS